MSNDAARVAAPCSSVWYLNNGHLIWFARKSPRLIVPLFFSAGLQQNALSASDASVSVQPSYQTCPTDRPSSQVKPGVGGSAQHRAGDRLLFTNPAFLFSNSNAPLVIGCTSLLLLYGHQCKVWHRSTMVTAMLVLHMWVRSLFRESFSPLNPSLMFSTGPRIYS